MNYIIKDRGQIIRANVVHGQWLIQWTIQVTIKQIIRFEEWIQILIQSLFWVLSNWSKKVSIITSWGHNFSESWLSSWSLLRTGDWARSGWESGEKILDKNRKQSHMLRLAWWWVDSCFLNVFLFSACNHFFWWCASSPLVCKIMTKKFALFWQICWTVQP